MSSRFGSHPEKLLWYAAGRLERAEAMDIELHLAACDECRAEVEAQRSMRQSLRTQALGEHPGPESLVQFHDAAHRLPVDEREALERHIRECFACSADLRALSRASSSESHGSRRRFVAVAASIFVLAVAGWRLGTWKPGPAPSAEVAPVVFQSAQRGGEVPRLSGPGPWTFQVWPPLHASSRSYRVEIQRADKPEDTIFEATGFSRPEDGRVELLVAARFRPGFHILTLIPRDGPGSDRYVHGFDVKSPP